MYINNWKLPADIYPRLGRSTIEHLESQGVDLTDFAYIMVTLDTRDVYHDDHDTQRTIPADPWGLMTWPEVTKELIAAIPHRWYDNIAWFGYKVSIAVVIKTSDSSRTQLSHSPAPAQ